MYQAAAGPRSVRQRLIFLPEPQVHGALRPGAGARVARWPEATCSAIARRNSLWRRVSSEPYFVQSGSCKRSTACDEGFARGPPEPDPMRSVPTVGASGVSRL